MHVPVHRVLSDPLGNTHHEVVWFQQLTGIGGPRHGEKLGKCSRKVPVCIGHTNQTTAPALIQGLCVCVCVIDCINLSRMKGAHKYILTYGTHFNIYSAVGAQQSYIHNMWSVWGLGISVKTICLAIV